MYIFSNCFRFNTVLLSNPNFRRKTMLKAFAWPHCLNIILFPFFPFLQQYGLMCHFSFSVFISFFFLSSFSFVVVLKCISVYFILFYVIFLLLFLFILTQILPKRVLFSSQYLCLMCRMCRIFHLFSKECGHPYVLKRMR